MAGFFKPSAGERGRCNYRPCYRGERILFKGYLMPAIEPESSQVPNLACQNAWHSSELHICNGCYEAGTAAVNRKEAGESANRVTLRRADDLPMLPAGVRLQSGGLALK